LLAFDMRDPNSRSVRGAVSSLLFRSGCAVALVVLLSSCSADLPVQREAQPAEEGVGTVAYSIVCIIHGDGDYLYHDTSGNEYRADEEALARAKRVALQNPHAEVLIFHQKPKKSILFLFPVRDGEFYYYRNGRLLAHESYWRDHEQAHFIPEVGLYRRFHSENHRELARLFLYCGQEIPEFGGAGYDASYPDRPFTVHDLADGLKGFIGDSARFDLLVLSSCFGGTPYTISALGPFARYIIASPDNLHLSYFDIHSLDRLDLSLGEGEVPAFAKRFAQQSFDRLTRTVQTAVSVAVYDVDRVQGYLDSVKTVYSQMLTIVKGEPRASPIAFEHCDCAEVRAYVLPAMSDGVDVFYRSARFGRSKGKQNHSGWECWRERASQSAGTRTSQPVSQ